MTEELKMLPDLNTTFFIDEVEYRVCFINENEDRFSAVQVKEDEKTNLPEIDARFIIGHNCFIVLYVNIGKKRITAKNIKNIFTKKENV